MANKILSINLWYDTYKNKTQMQLKSFRKLGYKTDLAVITSHKNSLGLTIYHITDANHDIILNNSYSSYSKAFFALFKYCEFEMYDFLYIRRLMSKLLPASKYLKRLSKNIPIVYEIPTYPLDTGNSIPYKIRDFIEMSRYKAINKYIKLTLVNLIDESVSIPDNWYIFHNALDIDNYYKTGCPILTNTIKFIIIANISEYHHYERIIQAINNYSGSYIIQLTIVSPESTAYSDLKKLVYSLGLESKITFNGSLPLNRIQNIAKDYHIGVAQLSTSKKGSNLVNTLKSKDYCAMGLPFISTCYDTSFEKDFPYAYVTKTMDDNINLNEIIDWYLNIRTNVNYRDDMYNYAKKNLQYDKYARHIINELNLD